jgi:PEP-CTERM motif
MEGKKMFRKLRVFAALIAAGTAAHAGPVLLSEGFNDVSTLAASGWVMSNQSVPVGETGWFQGNSGVFAAQSGAADSYIAANYLNAGLGGNVDNWLITPVVELAGGSYVNFSARTNGAVPGDTLDVYYNSSGSTNLADFVLLGNVTFGDPASWTALQFVHTGWTDTRFAFRYTVTDTLNNGDYIGIDTLDIKGVPEPETLALFGMGLLLMPLALRRRRTRA